MKSNVLLKVCALASSLLLVIAFISYRAGAFDWAIDSNDLPADTGDQRAASNVHADGKLFPSSKSGAVFVESEASSPSQTESPRPSAQEAPVVMSGSKSWLPSNLPPQTNQNAGAAEDRLD